MERQELIAAAQAIIQAERKDALICLYVCLICLPYMSASSVCLICLPYLSALSVCLICLPYLSHIIQAERKEQKIELARERRIVDDLIDEFNRSGRFDKTLHARWPIYLSVYLSIYLCTCT